MSHLRIDAREHDAFLSIERRDDGNDSGYAIEVDLGDYRGRNHDVQLLHLAAFAAGLDAFVTDRSRPVRLEGTYGFVLELAPLGVTGVWLDVVLAYERGVDGRRMVRYAVQGGFEIDTEYLVGYAAAFRTLAAS